MAQDSNSKERPILFSASMVRALLEGTKTQTRRVVKPQPDCNLVSLAHYAGRPPVPFAMLEGRYSIPCPYGQPGDRLWVQEGYQIDWKERSHPFTVIFRYLENNLLCEAQLTQAEFTKWQARKHPRRACPGRFMYRSLSRITLEVVSVRVERLQEISEEDAMAEGIELKRVPTGVVDESCGVAEMLPEEPSEAYQRLWESINGPGSWATNPFVWVIQFRRLKAPDCPSEAEPRGPGPTGASGGKAAAP